MEKIKEDWGWGQAAVLKRVDMVSNGGETSSHRWTRERIPRGRKSRYGGLMARARLACLRHNRSM